MKDEWPKRCETKEGEKKENESEDFRWWEERERERESKEKEVLQGVLEVARPAATASLLPGNYAITTPLVMSHFRFS